MNLFLMSMHPAVAVAIVVVALILVIIILILRLLVCFGFKQRTAFFAIYILRLVFGSASVTNNIIIHKKSYS